MTYQRFVASQTSLRAESEGDIDEKDLTPEQKEAVVGNLVADDEWVRFSLMAVAQLT